MDVAVGLGRRGEKWRGDEVGTSAITDSPGGPPAWAGVIGVMSWGKRLGETLE